MHQRVALFRMLRHRLFVHSGELRDLAGELLIEELPSFAARQSGGHQAAAGAIFAFHGDDLEHRPPPPEAAFSMITRILNRGCGNNVRRFAGQRWSAETKASRIDVSGWSNSGTALTKKPSRKQKATADHAGFTQLHRLVF